MSSPAAGRPGFLLKRAQLALHQAGTEQLRTIGMSMAQHAVLRQLAEHPGVASAELARLCFVTRQSLRDVLGGLQAAGQVRVAEQATTGRALPVTLTTAGEAALEAADILMSKVEARMLAGIPAAERRVLAALLTTCADNLA